MSEKWSASFPRHGPPACFRHGGGAAVGQVGGVGGDEVQETQDGGDRQGLVVGVQPAGGEMRAIQDRGSISRWMDG